MVLSRTVSEINGDFCRKSQFFHPVYFAPPLTGFPLELGTDEGVRKNRNDVATMLPEVQKVLRLCLAV